MSDQHTDQQPIVPVDELTTELVSQNLTTRRKMRSLLFHILYAADAFDYETPATEIARNFNREYETNIDLDGEIIKTVNEIAKKRDELDQEIIPFLENWKFDRIGRCTLLVLRYAIWEMLYSTTPHNIVINEAIELAKCFAEQDSYKFVNGILDKIHVSHQPDGDLNEEI